MKKAFCFYCIFNLSIIFAFNFNSFNVQRWQKLLEEKMENLCLSKGEDQKILEFIQHLNLHPEIAGLFDQSTGVWEGYSLEKHTLMVLRSYFKYFFPRKLPTCISQKDFILFLTLHDIGKPIASKKGNKDLQYKYNPLIISKIEKDLPYFQKDLYLMLSIDPLGKFFKGGNLRKAADIITRTQRKSCFLKEDFFYLLTIYYQVDAGSYTQEAGGVPSLEFLFQNQSFNENQKRRFFSKHLEKKYFFLKKAVLG